MKIWYTNNIKLGTVRKLTLRNKIESLSQSITDGFYSNIYILLVMIVSIFSFAYRLEPFGMITLIVLMSANLLFCRDITPSFVTFMFACMIPLGMYGAKFQDYVQYWWVALFLLPAFIGHICIYPVKDVKKGSLFWGIALYAFAILLGGIGSIPVEHYFKPAALYYVVLLGPGMACFYLMFRAYIPDDTAKTKDYFARSMAMIGVMILLMWVSAYVVDFKNNKELNIIFPYRQWKNNLGNYTLLAMPFAFYLATYKKGGVFYFILGILDYIAICLSMCRGGMLAATAVFPFLIIFTFVYAKKPSKRIIFGLVFAMVLLAMACICIIEKDLLIETIKKAIAGGSSGRNKLYDEAVRNFLSNPIFGVGLGHLNKDVYDLKEMSMFWYHSTIFQVIGSMGLLGLVTWLYMTFTRLRVLLRRNSFNIFMFLGILAFEGYSMINTGDFAPLPFVTMLTFMLTLCDKHNENIKQEKLEELTSVAGSNEKIQQIVAA